MDARLVHFSYYLEEDWVMYSNNEQNSICTTLQEPGNSRSISRWIPPPSTDGNHGKLLPYSDTESGTGLPEQLVEELCRDSNTFSLLWDMQVIPGALTIPLLGLIYLPQKGRMFGVLRTGEYRVYLQQDQGEILCLFRAQMDSRIIIRI